MTWFEASEEVAHPKHPPGDWRLVLQYGTYHQDDGEKHTGYRFIWRRPDGSLQSRPARIPSMSDMILLAGRAAEEGWGDR